MKQKNQNRGFGLLFFIVFLVLALWPLRNGGEVNLYLIFTALIFLLLGLLNSKILTPLKTLFEYDAINITLGLPFTRISPDHGPNESMLGKNLSNPLSLFKAIKFMDKN